jgi:hypothetical protein
MHHPVQTATAAAAALVAVAFGLSTLERWLAHRRQHELAWCAALAMFAVAAGVMAAGAQGGWSGAEFRAFYLFGAIANVPFLALGTVYLLAGTRCGNRAAVGVAVAAAFAAGVVVTAPFTHPVPRQQLAQGSHVFGPLPRVFAAVGSGGAAVVIFGGAAWSAWRWWRGSSVGASARDARRLALSNLLIAAGTLILSASGLLNSVVGAMTGFSATLLAGIVVIFSGFLVAAGGRTAPAAEPWRPPAGLSAPDLSLPRRAAGAKRAGAASRPGRAGATARR